MKLFPSSYTKTHKRTKFHTKQKFDLVLVHNIELSTTVVKVDITSY